MQHGETDIKIFIFNFFKFHKHVHVDPTEKQKHLLSGKYWYTRIFLHLSVTEMDR